MSSRVAVAMSGGVDSSVAALLLAKDGYEAIGISMQVWDYRNHGGSCTRATCCAPDDFTDARRVAARVGIPYYVFDFEKTFRREVIDRFVDTYYQGETPNPCVDCNSKVKFRELRTRAEAFGCDAVATGHYARIRRSTTGYHLDRGSDLDKDQSYFLYNLTQQELSRTLFPVGHLKKSEVREMAGAAGLVTASKPESQDICFVSGSAGDFVSRIGRRDTSGKIVSRSGAVLGEHDGIHHFTVGQRRGLRVGGTEEPLYVLEIDSDERRVIVGPRSELQREGFLVRDPNWVSPRILEVLSRGADATFMARAQLRHRHPGVPVEVRVSPGLPVAVKFIGEWSTVSPGQAAVFYDVEHNTEVLGGGRISGVSLERYRDSEGSGDLNSLLK